MILERLYGWRDENLELGARRLESHLGPGEPHESLYFGGDYYLWRLGSTEVVLQTNRDLDEELAEPDHPDFPLLVRVSAEGDLSDWEAASAGLGLVALRPPSGRVTFPHAD